jgi:RNA polymerase sigma-70 factor (ECF subfamily)
VKELQEMAVTVAAWRAAAVATSDHEVSERDLIQRSRAGDVEAFGQLYLSYEAIVYRHAYRLLENADDADDVRQETFVRAFQSLTKFRGDATLKTYLLAICGNLCRDRQRQRVRRPEREYGLTVPETLAGLTNGYDCDPAEGPLRHFERAAASQRVQEALRRLPPPVREILLLRHVEDLGLDEIALILNCSRVSAPVRLFRARQQFKEIFLTLLKEEGE